MDIKLYIQDNQDIPAVQILPLATPAPNGYTDFTFDLIKWRDFALQSCTDYLQYKNFVTEVMGTKVWANLTDTEADFIINNYVREAGVTSQDDATRKVIHLMTVHGKSQSDSALYLQNAYAEFHLKEISSCFLRSQNKTLFQIIAKYLQNMDAADFTDVIEHPYYMFTTQGIRGVNDGETGEGLFDFIESTVGTSYETAGLAQQGYIMANGDPDMSNFILELMNVLRNGNYEIE